MMSGSESKCEIESGEIKTIGRINKNIVEN